LVLSVAGKAPHRQLGYATLRYARKLDGIYMV
jgi:hypothetical protein